MGRRPKPPRVGRRAATRRRIGIRGAPDRIDLITAGDICYERDMTTRVMAWLRAQAGAGVTVLIGDPGRDYLPRPALAPVATMVVPTMADLEDASTRTTTIWRVLP